MSTFLDGVKFFCYKPMMKATTHYLKDKAIAIICGAKLRTTSTTIISLIIAFTGGVTANLLHIPAPWLIGSMLAVILANVCHLAVGFPIRLINLAQLVIGFSLASGLTENIFGDITNFLQSLIILVIFLFSLQMTGSLVLIRFFGYDGKSAALATMPGALSYVLALVRDNEIKVNSIIIIQITRLLSLVMIAPLVVKLIGGDGKSGGSKLLGAVNHIPWTSLTFLALSFIIALLIVKFWQFPSVFLITGFAISAVGRILGVITEPLPQWLAIGAFIIIGASAASSLNRINRRELVDYFWQSLTILIVLLVFSVGFAFLVYGLTAIPFIEVLIAFAPGGIEAVAAMVLSLELNSAFIAIHHLIRLLVIVVTMGSMIKLIELIAKKITRPSG